MRPMFSDGPVTNSPGLDTRGSLQTGLGPQGFRRGEGNQDGTWRALLRGVSLYTGGKLRVRESHSKRVTILVAAQNQVIDVLPPPLCPPSPTKSRVRLRRQNVLGKEAIGNQSLQTSHHHHDAASLVPVRQRSGVFLRGSGMLLKRSCTVGVCGQRILNSCLFPRCSLRLTVESVAFDVSVRGHCPS